jgi:hypothetical protein
MTGVAPAAAATMFCGAARLMSPDAARIEPSFKSPPVACA